MIPADGTRRSWRMDGEWELTGWRQNDWLLALTPERHKVRTSDVATVPATVPGSVRGALRRAGLVPDPHVGEQSRLSEWIEHRDWEFRTVLPDAAVAALAADPSARGVLRFDALDAAGTVLLDEHVLGRFDSGFVPWSFEIGDAVRAGARTLRVVFTDVADGLGQNGWTSRIRAQKSRFYYGWDWTPRIVQIGLPGAVAVEVVSGPALHDVQVRTHLAAVDTSVDAVALVLVDAEIVGGADDATHAVTVGAVVRDASGAVVCTGSGPVGRTLEVPVSSPPRWDPRSGAAEALHTVDVELRDAAGTVLDVVRRRVGFRSVEWRATADAPVGAEPWLCVVNGRPTFLAGVNWVPIRADSADVPESEYRRRLEEYRRLGFVMLRVWGGAAAEREVFYDLCDELGLLVWQELPLSSSGLDNAPPDDPDFAAGLAAVARSYALRLGHHPCIVLWSGGNELTAVTAPAVPGAPLTDRHPALRAARDALAAVDPGRRFIATSPLGPRFEADAAEFGRGLHHDVHGPWEFSGSEQEWADYWASDDAVLRSEVGVAGASPLSLLHDVGLTSAGGTERTRQLWTHSSGWWLAEFDRTATDDLATWVTESQERQARLLAVAAGASARRFPACAGFLVWLGHDAFPCAVSLSLLDFDGRPKPAAAAVAAAIAEGLGADA